jgi:hypothetical protein
MSASHGSSPTSASAAVTTATKSQLDFDNILELLQKGLIDLMSCFSKDDDRAGEFKAKFTADLIRSPANKKLFNLYGPLMIKAGYPLVYKHLSHEEASNLQKMGVTHIPQDVDVSVGDFFLRGQIEKFIRSDVKDKYQEEMLKLVDAVYKFIVAATYSVEYEQTLLSFDKEGQPIADKDRKFGQQASIVSGVDLQISEAINSVKLGSSALIKLKGGKTSKADIMTEAVGKIRALIGKASAEYTKNLQERLSKKDNQAMAQQAEKDKLDLLEAKAAMQSVQAQLAEQQHKAEEQQRKAEELAAQKLELERLAAEFAAREASANEERARAQSASAAAAANPVVVQPHAAAADVAMLEKLQKEKQQLEKKNKYLQASYRAKEITDQVMAEAKNTEISSAALTKIFDQFLKNLSSPKLTQEILLQNLLAWEKAALSYTEKKKPNEGAAASATTSALRFIGQKTGLGKTITPHENMALKSELKTMLTQSILMSVMEMHGGIKEVVDGLNQHVKGLVNNHKASHLQEGAVSSQLMQLAEAITNVAVERFGYVKAPIHGAAAGAGAQGKK